jgi:putative transcriptional regulator
MAVKCSNFVLKNNLITNMADINRIRIALVERKKTSKWLAEQVGKDPATVSKWCTNKTQPSLETLVEVAKILEMDPRELIIPVDTQKVMMAII